MRIELSSKSLQESFKKAKTELEKELGFKLTYPQVLSYLLKMLETAEKE